MENENGFVKLEDDGDIEEPPADVCGREAAQTSNQVYQDQPDQKSQNPWPHLEDYFVLKSRDQRNDEILYFGCVICQPKETTIKGHASSLANLKSHIKRNHPAHAIRFEEKTKAGSSRGKHRKSSDAIGSNMRSIH